MLLCGLLVDRSPRGLNALSVEVPRLPDEILDQVPLVLGEQQVLRLLDSLSDVSDELPALCGELGRGVGKRPRLEEAVQGNIDLVVLLTRDH